MKKKLTKTEAQFMAWMEAFSFVSLNANSTDEDFYDYIHTTRLIDSNRAQNEGFFHPDEREKEMIRKEMANVSLQISKKMHKLIAKYNKENPL